LLALALVLWASACDTPEPGAPMSVGSIADQEQPADWFAKRDHGRMCRHRRDEALLASARAYREHALRWPCRDVDEIEALNDDAYGGQEYCEYFAVVQMDIGGRVGLAPFEGGRFLDVPHAAKPTRAVTTGTVLGLDRKQSEWFIRHANDPVGACVFTSWFADNTEPLPACRDAKHCADLFGLTLTADHFRMRRPDNSLADARRLLAGCARRGSPLVSDIFMRGCQLLEQYGLGRVWRRSDPVLCAAAMRMAECGCLQDRDAFAAALTSKDGEPLRGLPLGAWSGLDRRPPDCHWVQTGENSHTLLYCTLHGNDVLTAQLNLKSACKRFADQVVVHVPIAGIECPRSTPDCRVPWAINGGPLE
jgi:hypothetical protein